MPTSERPLCGLHLAQLHREECPGDTCPFWEQGGAVAKPGCAIERMGLAIETRPDIASWLLSVRHELENAHSEEEATAVRASLNGFLPPGLHN